MVLGLLGGSLECVCQIFNFLGLKPNYELLNGKHNEMIAFDIGRKAGGLHDM